MGAPRLRIYVGALRLRIYMGALRLRIYMGCKKRPSPSAKLVAKNCKWNVHFAPQPMGELVEFRLFLAFT